MILTVKEKKIKLEVKCCGKSEVNETSKGLYVGLAAVVVPEWCNLREVQLCGWKSVHALGRTAADLLSQVCCFPE